MFACVLSNAHPIALKIYRTDHKKMAMINVGEAHALKLQLAEVQDEMQRVQDAALCLRLFLDADADDNDDDVELQDSEETALLREQIAALAAVLESLEGAAAASALVARGEYKTPRCAWRTGWTRRALGRAPAGARRRVCRSGVYGERPAGRRDVPPPGSVGAPRAPALPR